MGIGNTRMGVVIFLIFLSSHLRKCVLILEGEEGREKNKE